MKLLITGGFGYLGARLARFLAGKADYEVLLGSRYEVKSPAWLPQAKVVQTRWESSVKLDNICDGTDAIIHLAGMNAQDCSSDPVAALETNAVATARLLQAAIRQDVQRFIYLSSIHVYRSPLSGLINEETCPSNLHPYAASHRAGEDVVRVAHQRRDIEGVVIRLSNAYGAPEHQDVNCWMLLANDLCRQAVLTKHMVLHSSGTQKRNFIAVTDACRAIRHLMDMPAEKLGDGLFNVGSFWSPTILEVAERIADRVYAVTGERPGLSCRGVQEPGAMETFNYEIRKLASTGFELGCESLVDREIDGLIRFCLEHRCELS